MGQIAKDWTELKAIIKQKDDAIDKQAAQIAALQKQLTTAQQAALDADDQKAIAELKQTVGDNAPAAPMAAVPAPAPTSAAPAAAPAVRASASVAPVAPALAHPAAPARPATTPVTTFTK